MIDPEPADRAGAHTNVTVEALARRLRILHPNYSSIFMNWFCWANFIVAKPAHLHEQLALDLPPDHLINLFALNQPEDQRLVMMRQSFTTAKHMMENIKENVMNLKVILQDITRRMEFLANTVEIYENTLHFLVTTTAPIADDTTEEALNQLANLQDTEHL